MQIKEYLDGNDITAAQFARRINVLKQTFFKYVHGIAFPPPRILRLIAAETKGEVTADDFVDLYINRQNTKTGRAS
jgi:hypothetical protein